MWDISTINAQALIFDDSSKNVIIVNVQSQLSLPMQEVLCFQCNEAKSSMSAFYSYFKKMFSYLTLIIYCTLFAITMIFFPLIATIQ